MRYLDYLYTFSRWGLGILFVYAGGRKLLAPAVFATLIDAFGIVPENLLPIVAVLLPVLEVLTGIALLVDIQGGLAVAAGLLMLFIVILGYGLRMGLDVDCGCFGPGDPEARAFHGMRVALIRDLALMAVVGWLVVWRHRRGLWSTRPVSLGSKRS
jgi:uncharacterized membrane protein YphA (DoxX/SURF4 family)